MAAPELKPRLRRNLSSHAPSSLHSSTFLAVRTARLRVSPARSSLQRRSCSATSSAWSFSKRSTSCVICSRPLERISCARLSSCVGCSSSRSRIKNASSIVRSSTVRTVPRPIRSLSSGVSEDEASICSRSTCSAFSSLGRLRGASLRSSSFRRSRAASKPLRTPLTASGA